MIESYLVLAGRIRQELDGIERLVMRASRALAAAQKHQVTPTFTWILPL